MNKKKILFIETQKYPDVVGGAEIFDYYLIKEICQSIPILYLSYTKWDTEAIEHIKLPSIKPHAIFTPFFIFIKLIKHKHEISTIHFRYSRSKWINYWPFLLLNYIYKIPYVITIHGGGLSKWLFNWFYQRLFKRAENVIGVSKAICSEYSIRLERDISHCPPLLPFKRSKNDKLDLRKTLKVDEKAKVFLFVGSLKTIKSPITIIRAISEFDRDYLSKNKIIILFAGDGPQIDELKNMIQDNDLDNFLVLLGNIKNELLKDYYKISDYYIISSKFEGTPIGLLEAMFNELTIIGSDVIGINTIIKHNENGLLFKYNDQKMLLENIKLIIEKDKIAKNLAQNAKLDFEKLYQYSSVTNFYLGIFQ